MDRLTQQWIEVSIQARTQVRRRLSHSSVSLSMMLRSTPCQTCSKRCFSSSRKLRQIQPWTLDPASDVSRDVPYRLLQLNSVLDFQRQHFALFKVSRIQSLDLFSVLVDYPTSLLLFNNSTGYRSSSESCSKLLRLCTTLSINVLSHTLKTSLHFASMTSNVCLSHKNAVRATCFFAASPGMFGTVSLLLLSTIVPHSEEY